MDPDNLQREITLGWRRRDPIGSDDLGVIFRTSLNARQPCDPAFMEFQRARSRDQRNNGLGLLKLPTPCSNESNDIADFPICVTGDGTLTRKAL